MQQSRRGSHVQWGVSLTWPHSEWW